MPTASVPFLEGRRAWLKSVAAAGLAAAWPRAYARVALEPRPHRVRIWCEGTAPRQVYPDDVDGVLAEALRGRADFQVTTARLRDPDCGLDDTALDATDVLVWWGRLCHDDLPDDRARAVADRVRAGRLGLVALHASFGSKPFRALMGRDCEPDAWREQGQPERIEIAAPDHPIARGVESFVIPRATRFAEPFAVPEPEAVVLLSRYEDGQTFRSGMAWTVGDGRVAYLRPGDDAYPVLFHPSVRTLVANAVAWCGAPRAGVQS